MSKFKQVIEDQYKAALSKWPNKLEWSVANFCEPPVGTHNDFSGGKVWPDSVVGKVIFMSSMKDYQGYNDEPDEYFLREDLVVNA